MPPRIAVLVLSEALLVVVVVIEEIMQFAHEQLDVCQISHEYAVRESWAPYGDYDNDNDNDHDHGNECPYPGDLCVLCESKKTRGQRSEVRGRRAEVGMSNSRNLQPVTRNL